MNMHDGHGRAGDAVHAMDLIVGLAVLFAIAFFAAWLMSPRLRAWVERPKYRFQANVRSYDEAQGATPAPATQEPQMKPRPSNHFPARYGNGSGGCASRWARSRSRRPWLSAEISLASKGLRSVVLRRSPLPKNTGGVSFHRLLNIWAPMSPTPKCGTWTAGWPALPATSARAWNPAISASQPHSRSTRGFHRAAARNETIEDRINGCMMRSMNGRALPEKSPEMMAMVAYLRFLADQDAATGATQRRAHEPPP